MQLIPLLKFWLQYYSSFNEDWITDRTTVYGNYYPTLPVSTLGYTDT
jgi:hypothetical protein